MNKEKNDQYCAFDLIIRFLGAN